MDLHGGFGWLRDGPVCAAALRLHQVADALVSTPVVLEPRFAALPLAFISQPEAPRTIVLRSPGTIAPEG